MTVEASGKQRFNMTLVFSISIGLVWILYSLFGHRVIGLAYRGEAVTFLTRFMEGRAVTPLGAYYRRGDELMVRSTLWFVTTYCVLWFILKKPLELALTAFSLFGASFLVFCFFEIFPSLMAPFHLESFSAYYAYRANFIYDDKLAVREKPFNRGKAYNYRGDKYSPLYEIDVPPLTLDWVTDKNGFRNSRTTLQSDIVVIGDSYLEWGTEESDTFVSRLEKHLPGLTVTNLGKSGYGPFQYLEVLKRFGLMYQPEFALLGFYEGNDISDIRNYLRWKRGLPGPGMYAPQPSHFLLGRYWEVLTEIVASLRSATWVNVELVLNRFAQSHGYGEAIHPDVAFLDLGSGRQYKALLYHLNDPQAPDEILQTQEWRELRKILLNFKDISLKNHIMPIIVYFPTAAHIYASYSTNQSGRNWRAIRDEQIAARSNMENAMERLSQQLHIDLISISPTFDRAAKEGKLLYHRLDTHWNSEGKEVAADFVAGTLKSKYLGPVRKSTKTELRDHL